MTEPAARGGAGITGESDAVAVENAGGGGRFVILCDHAANRFPPEFGSLGLSAADRAAHVAWDPGALGVARELARRLDAPLVRSTVSRLVIDCNRDPSDPDSIVETTVPSGVAIPGNAALSDAERRRRVAAVHAPYHAAVEALLAARLAVGRPTSLVAVHSFTPVYRGVSRPWEVGVIYDRDRRLSAALIDALAAEGLKVGANEPYSPADRVYYTLARHAEARGLAPAMIEIRNDLIRSAGEQAAWAKRIGAHLASTVVVQQPGAVSATCQTL